MCHVVGPCWFWCLITYKVSGLVQDFASVLWECSSKHLEPFNPMSVVAKYCFWDHKMHNYSKVLSFLFYKVVFGGVFFLALSYLFKPMDKGGNLWGFLQVICYKGTVCFKNICCQMWDGDESLWWLEGVWTFGGATAPWHCALDAFPLEISLRK